MLRSVLVCVLLSASMVACDSAEDVEAWVDAQGELDDGTARSAAAADAEESEGETLVEPVLTDYECTYRCEKPRNQQTTTVSQTSALAAEAEVNLNGDSNGDNIADFCPGSNVTEVNCK